MRPTLLLRARTPMIHFLGKRIPPNTITPAAPADSPAPHPASPSSSLPDSFILYRSKAQQHGPLAGHKNPSSSPGPPQQSSPSSSSQPPSTAAATPHAYGTIAGHSGHALGSVEPDEGKGEVWDRSELPKRFGRLGWSEEEIEGVGMGGAGVRVGWGGA